MKRRFLILPALCLTLIFGCDTDRRTGQSEGYQETEEGLGTETETEDGFGAVDTERTSATGMEEEEKREFLQEFASSSMMEVELSQMAQEKAQSTDVRNYAEMIVNDHQQANERLKNIAQQENIDIPQTLKEEHQEEVEDLREKTGSDFDREYMDKMVNQHEEDIDKLEDKREEVQDQELQSFIDSQLNTLRQHKEQAEQLQEQVGGGNEIL